MKSIKTGSVLLLIALTMYLFSCTSGVSNHNSNTSVVSTIQDNSDKFLAFFKPANPNNLHIYPPSDTIQGSTFRFMGTPIDSTFYTYFSSQGWDPDSTKSQLKVFACFKFNLANGRTGLLIRRPSQYSESAIDLCIWNNDAKKIINEIEVSDAFGDGEWYFNKDAWLTDINKDGLLDIITRQKDWDGEDTNYPEGIVTDSLKVYIAQGDSFKRTPCNVDTNKYEVLNWNK